MFNFCVKYQMFLWLIRVSDHSLLADFGITITTEIALGILRQMEKFNCSVEPLEYGVILPEKMWSSNQAIFPKGYKSRVKYFSLKDPTQMCYYISEILDAGSRGPLFMVQVEQCATDIFVHACIAKCWDLVRERVNIEIRRQQSYGNFNATLQPPGSVDGFEMFGFSTPEIVKAIEAMDCNHVCSEYWSSGSDFTSGDAKTKSDAGSAIKEHSSPSHGTIIQELYTKANDEELQVLHSLLTCNPLISTQDVIGHLNEEINKSILS